ncbi:hypothetical protein [Segetibacter aerophilus]|uniref:Outer membrane protein beta-barrel domain-containing protein n=1 Tax=Segetibacter aerophilus TaxID=670293 RepID=A0A512B8V4_9BACT|nr:hypothetical protein [Segetibacter aerophilus]GEO08359.1 hypothetical protein SAE01_08550 [Segetibacter aerophilus]
MRETILASLIIITITSCAPTRFVKPLAKKQQAVNLSLGGALISYSKLTIPMPFVTATYGYGIDSTLTGFGALNITSLVYGNAQVELGLTKQLLQQKGVWPGVSVSPVANIIYRNKDASKVYPQVDINAFWDYNNKRNFFYVGISNWFELAGKRVYDQEQEHHWLFNPMIGETFVRNKWNYNIELKVIAPNIANNTSIVDYKTPFGSHGAFGIYIGCTRKF